jgi:hypothetical protein
VDGIFLTIITSEITSQELSTDMELSMKEEILNWKGTASINSVFLPGNASIQKQQYYKNERS